MGGRTFLRLLSPAPYQIGIEPCTVLSIPLTRQAQGGKGEQKPLELSFSLSHPPSGPTSIVGSGEGSATSCQRLSKFLAIPGALIFISLPFWSILRGQRPGMPERAQPDPPTPK